MCHIATPYFAVWFAMCQGLQIVKDTIQIAYSITQCPPLIVPPFFQRGLSVLSECRNINLAVGP